MSSSPTSSFSSEAATAVEEPGGPLPLSTLFDVTWTVDFILGTGTVKVRDCLGLMAHSVLRLDQVAGADLELRVHGQSIAHGEAVVVDNNTTLRINRVVSPTSVRDEA